MRRGLTTTLIQAGTPARKDCVGTPGRKRIVCCSKSGLLWSWWWGLGDLWRVPGKRLEQSGEGETEKCKGEEQEEQAWGAGDQRTGLVAFY